MKILGVSLGTKNGSNDAMCKEALIAAQEMGAEVSFIHLLDWDIKHCTGCVACSRGLVMGKGNICTQKDEFDDFRDKILDADGIIWVDPIFECGASGLAHTIMDRFGPRMDRGMNLVAHQIAANDPTGKAKDVDPRLLDHRCISFIGIGGSDWATAIEYDNSILALSGGWTIVDNKKFAWSKNIIMEDEKVEECRQVGRNMVEALKVFMEVKDSPDYEKDYKTQLWKGEKGVCPHCHGKNFYFPGQTDDVICMTCGIEGKMAIVNGEVQFTFTEEAAVHAHDLMSGKFMHADDIKENEGKAIANRKSDKFKASAERIKSYNIPEILPPSRVCNQ